MRKTLFPLLALCLLLSGCGETPAADASAEFFAMDTVMRLETLGLSDPAAVTASQVELLVQETCVAEVVHTASILLGLGALWLWPGWGGVVLWLIWFLLANLPFILIQRYNRPRLMRLHALLQRREQRKGAHEHSDPDL